MRQGASNIQASPSRNVIFLILGTFIGRQWTLLTPDPSCIISAANKVKQSSFQPLPKLEQPPTILMAHNQTTSKLQQAQSNCQRQRIPKLSFNKTSTDFSACIILKEDNHWFSEWLPYHYYTARLRHLIVVTDPTSRTSPKEILNRWKDRINIIQWKDKNFMKKRQKPRNKDALKVHLNRQKVFYQSCILHFKKKKKSWLMLTDSDEFLRVSHNHSLELETTKEGYVADFLESTASNRTCLTIARYQVSSQEDNHTARIQTENELPFNITNFLTYRFMYHNGKTMGHGKSIINLRNLKKRKVQRNIASVHLAINGTCPPNPPGSTKDAASDSIALQHYLGTWEQFSFRQDPRNQMKDKLRLDRWKVAGRDGHLFRDSSMASWLDGFVNQVGLPEAERLVKDVGIVDSIR